MRDTKSSEAIDFAHKSENRGFEEHLKHALSMCTMVCRSLSRGCERGARYQDSTTRAARWKGREMTVAVERKVVT